MKRREFARNLLGLPLAAALPSDAAFAAPTKSRLRYPKEARSPMCPA